jgi:hypothetical protein
MSRPQDRPLPAAPRARALRRATQALAAVLAARGRAFALPDAARADALARLGAALELLTTAAKSIEAGVIGPGTRRRISVAHLLAKSVARSVEQSLC